MCDYCDCRSHPQIAVLAEDHERALAVTAAIRRALAADDPATAAGLIGELAATLPPHFDREERGVFERLRRSGIGDDYVARFDAEHTELGALLQSSPSADVAARLVGLLEDHILREETDMFPAAHQVLAPGDWDAIDEQVGLPPSADGVLRARIEPEATRQLGGHHSALDSVPPEDVAAGQKWSRVRSGRVRRGRGEIGPRGR